MPFGHDRLTPQYNGIKLSVENRFFFDGQIQLFQSMQNLILRRLVFSFVSIERKLIFDGQFNAMVLGTAIAILLWHHIDQKNLF